MDSKVINETVMPMVLQVVECLDAKHWVVSAGDNDGERLVFPAEIQWSVDAPIIPTIVSGDYVRATVTISQAVTPSGGTLVAHTTLSDIHRTFLHTRGAVVLDHA